MTNRECEIIEDLLPLYADGVASDASLELVERHLSGCARCRELLEIYREPALPGLPENETGYLDGNGFGFRLRRLAVVLLAGIVIATSTIAWASYHAGRNMALRDPSFRQAEKMGLFTEVNQSRELGPYRITVDRVLLDTARTTVFYRVEPGLQDKVNLNVGMLDDKGVHYDPRGGRGLHGRDFVYDLEPVNLDAEKITLTFTTDAMPGEARFEIPVDPTTVAQETREIYPALKANAGPVEFAVDRAVLGLSESIVFFRIRWPRDPEIAGVGIGIDHPMHTTMGPGGPTSAEGRVSRMPPAAMIKGSGAFPPGFWADLVDETNGKRVKLEETRTQTDTLTGGIQGSFHFEPVDPSARQLKLTSPPLYLYRFPEQEQTMELTWSRQDKQSIDHVFKRGPVSFTLEKAAVEDKQLALYFKFKGDEAKPHQYYRPDFRIQDQGFWQEHIRLEWPDEEHVKVTFPRPEDEKVLLKLRSVGEKLPGIGFEINITP
ncbi:zf-HC2 domain-containing protein [Desulfallas sp. Bu1-1]|uniref:zf-HC2 domain-containing protein n=1 Tax=Desulfallas sp. Bu1-1 TaxID=2787620 RepID=UPI00189F230B|nr:zf-HC2 domain-containing protein [Desulfallas sp. Bu1-1]MBF7082276.1 zf-HC2 domain-containing protein [Desulfallas sp. Bu1-1]